MESMSGIKKEKGNQDFFDFGSKLISSNFHAHSQGLRIIIKEGISDNIKLLKGEFLGINFPVVFKQERHGGKKLQDIMDTSHPALYLISDNMKNILLENNITGWKSYPIKLFDKKGNEIFGYNGFAVTGRCEAKIQFRKDSIIEKRLAINAPISKFYKGLYIDFTKWDGNDIFTPKGSTWFIITEKVKDLILKNSLTNIKIRNIKDIEVHDFTIKKEDII